MASKYNDTAAVMQVIGCVYNDLSLLDLTDKYHINEEDFDNDFHKIIFGSIYRLHELGANKVNLETIADFLSSRPKSEAVYKQEKGEEWLTQVSAAANPLTFDYYYNRMKKFSLLRAYDKFGIDIKFIYDPDNIFDVKKKQAQEENLDNSSLEELANKVDLMISNIRATYVNDMGGEALQAGDDIDDLIEQLKQYPEVGVPMYGSLINAVTRGARLGKFYLRSAPTGVGKSRTMIADFCNIGCDEIYDDLLGWRTNGVAQPCLYISTEQDKSELQTMMLAFLASVNEDHILNGKYVGDEEQRVRHAAEVLKRSPIYIEVLPDFSLEDITDTIKKNIRDHDVAYVFYDYIHSSLKILEEVATRTRGMNLREDNILFMLSVKLKDIATKYNVFILSSTQLNGQYQDSETPDQNLLRGAKAIADKIDWGAIMLPATSTDMEGLSRILSNSSENLTPNMKMSIYKNRRGKYKGIYLWCKADLGTCRVNPIFATTYTYEMVQIEDLQIEIDKGAF